MSPDGSVPRQGAAEGHSSYIKFSAGSGPGDPIGVVVLANEKDAHPSELGNTLFGLLSGAPGGVASDGPEFGLEDDA